MAGINTLQEAYKKRGGDWIQEFLSSNLKITEKADAYRFSFERSQRGKLRFYGKHAEQPLNRVDRTVSDLYEGAISRIEKLPEGLIDNLPKNHRFGFDWSQEEGLALTDIVVRQQGKIVKQIHESEVLQKWSKLLGVKQGEEFYQGNLEKVVVDSLMESLQQGIQPVIGSDKKTYILRGGDSIIKIAPEATKFTKREKSHTFDLLLIQIYEHLQELDFSKFAYRSDRSDDRYLEVVCEAFNHFVESRGGEFVEMGIKKPDFLSRSGKFNKRWLRNKKTLALIESNLQYEYLLSVFLTNLRRPKKANGLLTESFIESFNEKLYELENSVRDCEEFGFPEFSVVVEKAGEPSPTTEFSDEDTMKATGMLQTYFSKPFSNTNEEKEVLHQANLLFMNVGMFTNRVLRECESILKSTGKGFVIIHDERAGTASKCGMASVEGQLAAKQLVIDYPHLFDCAETIVFPTLNALLKAGGERQIVSIYTGGNCDSLVKEKETHNALKKDAIETKISRVNAHNLEEVEACLHDDDFVKFKQIYPESIQKFWSAMRSSWQTKAYL